MRATNDTKYMLRSRPDPIGLWFNTETLNQLDKLRGPIHRNTFINLLVEQELKEHRIAQQVADALNKQLKVKLSNSQIKKADEAAILTK